MPRKVTKRGKKQAAPAKRPTKKTKKEEVSESESGSESDRAAPVVVTPVVVTPPAPKPIPAAATPQKDKKTLSDDSKQILADLVTKAAGGSNVVPTDLNDFTVNDLKVALKLNDRPTTGNRGDLVKAVCENIKLGCPPRCPDCGGGRLRFGLRKGKKQFWCPGFMEDDEFVNCGFSAGDGEVDRVPWVNP